MARALFLFAAAAAALAQAPWPQPDGSASHSRAVPVAWPRGATVLTQLNPAPLCSPVLIGANSTLYAAGSDELLHAFAPSGRELWALDLGVGACSLQLALNDMGSVLFASIPLSRSGEKLPIRVFTLSSETPIMSLITLDNVAVQAAVSGDLIVVLVGVPGGPYNDNFSKLMLNTFSPQGQLQWSSEITLPVPSLTVAVCGSALAIQGRTVFFSINLLGSDSYYFSGVGAFSLATGKLVWQTFSNPTSSTSSTNDGFSQFLVPGDGILLFLANQDIEPTSVLTAVNAATGSGLWTQTFLPASITCLAASAAGDYLALFSTRIATATGNTSLLPLPPLPSAGSVFLDVSGAIFSVAGESLFAFDIATGSELLSAVIPFGFGSLAFSASGQLFIGSGGGLFTLLPPPSASSTPSPPPTASRSPTPPPSPSLSPPAPAPATAPSAALPALGWSALGGCLGVAAALGAVASIPRLRAWLAPLQQQSPAPGAGGPTFAAAEHDYARLN